MKDARLIKTKALPAANAANYSDSIDLGQTYGGDIQEIGVEIDLPATPSLADTKVITLTLKDSADDSTFAAITGVSTVTATGVATSQGGPAVNRKIRLPQGTRRYIRLDAAVEASGGDNTGVSTTLSVQFPASR